MKKNFCLFLIFILLIPCVIEADMGAPMVRPYKMVVVNPDGLDCYDNTEIIHLNKNDLFTVEFSYGNNDFQIKLSNNTSCRLDSLEGAILVTDILNPKIAINENDNMGTGYIGVLPNESEALVYAKEGVDVRKGPADIYEVVDHLSEGVVFKYSYYITSSGHIYIDDGDTKGWVEILDSKVLIQSSDKYIVKKEINLDCGIIPKNTVLVSKYVASQWDRKVLIEYNGCSRLVERFYGDISDVSEMDLRKYVSKEEITIYEYYDDGGRELEKISANTEFDVLSDASDKGGSILQLYVSYNGQKGWVKVEHSNISFVSSSGQNNNNDLSDPNVEDQEAIDDNIINNENPINYTVTYIIVAFVISIVAIVVIILINRRKRHQK